MGYGLPPERPPSGDLNRAKDAIRSLERAGLGPLDWMGPDWIGAMADLSPGALEFVTARVHQDTKLQRALRRLGPGEPRIRRQMGALRRALSSYRETSGKPVGANLYFIDARHEDRRRPSQSA